MDKEITIEDIKYINILKKELENELMSTINTGTYTVIRLHNVLFILIDNIIDKLINKSFFITKNKDFISLDEIKKLHLLKINLVKDQLNELDNNICLSIENARDLIYSILLNMLNNLIVKKYILLDN